MSAPEDKREAAGGRGWLSQRGPVGGLPTSALVVIVIAVAVLVWLLFLRGDDGSESETAANGGDTEKTVEVVSADQLPDAVGDTGYPAYWVGPREGVNYEVTIISDGRTYVRYLPESEKAEVEKPFLTVGSYEQESALQVLEELAQNSDGRLFDVAGGGKGFERADSTTGVYVAFPGRNAQIEVFDPEPGAALELVESGAVVPIG